MKLQDYGEDDKIFKDFAGDGVDGGNCCRIWLPPTSEEMHCEKWFDIKDSDKVCIFHFLYFWGPGKFKLPPRVTMSPFITIVLPLNI